MLKLGDGVMQAAVDKKSPGYRAGVRSGDYVKPVRLVDAAESIPLDEFNARRWSVGTVVVIEFFRDGHGKSSGWMIGSATLRPRPKDRIPPKWKARPKVPCGEAVSRKERPKYLAWIARNREIKDRGVRILVLMLNYYLGPKGIIPSETRLASDIGCSRRAVQDHLERLHWLGLLRIAVSKVGNRYVPCWSANRGANVVPLHPITG